MSAKSILISPGFVIKSEIHFIPEYSILSIIKNACLKVVFLSITLKILSFGITINVSTAFFIFANHSSAFNSLCLPSKLKGLVTTHIVKIPISFAIFAITGPAHVHVPHHIHNVMKTISVSCSIFFISVSLSSAAFLPISGLAHAHKPFVRFNHILIFFGAKLLAKSCASVFIATKSTFSSHSLIILFTALFQQPPTHSTLIFAPGIKSGLISFIIILI